MPGHKIFCRCTAGAIQHLIRVHCHNKLCIAEQMRDIVLAPVPDILHHAFHNIHAGFFTFDYDQRDAVYQHNKIRTGKSPVRTFYLELVGHLKRIVLRVFKVDIADIKRLPGTIREFFLHALAGADQLVDFLICGIKPCCAVLIHRLHRSGNGSPRKVPCLTAKLIGLSAQKRLQFFRKQHCFPGAALPFRLAAGHNGIAQSFNYFQRPIL